MERNAANMESARLGNRLEHVARGVDGLVAASGGYYQGKEESGAMVQAKADRRVATLAMQELRDLLGRRDVPEDVLARATTAVETLERSWRILSPPPPACDSVRAHRYAVEVDTAIPWPDTDAPPISFDGRDFRLCATNARSPDRIEMPLPLDQTDTEHQQSVNAMNRFMSVLAWTYAAPLRQRHGAKLYKPSQFLPQTHTPRVRFSEPRFLAPCLHVPKDDQPLALALYRDALNVSSPAYTFLGFARVWNINHADKDQPAWINGACTALLAMDATSALLHNAQVRLRELDATLHLYGARTLGNYLYNMRCAAAHAKKTPRINPDESAELQRAHLDVPVAQALADYFIQQELKYARGPL